MKSEHRDAILFFRMGDFYEMFHSDAVEASRLLNIALTQRHGIPMCGVPYHAAQNYIGRLLNQGKKVAVCEQVAMSPGGKGLAHREVVEVVTPGTAVDDAFLDESNNNYLVSLAGTEEYPAFACLDLSTGEFRATMLNPDFLQESLRCELARTSPREMLVQQSLLDAKIFSFLLESGILLNRIPDLSMDRQGFEERLNRQFSTINLKAFGLNSGDGRIMAAGVILDYVEQSRKNVLSHVNSLECYDDGSQMGLDETTIRNLEIVKNMQDGGKNFTLLETMNHAKTSVGARLLRKRLLNPFRKAAAASAFHARVNTLYHSQAVLSDLRGLLGGMQDLERLAARIGMDRAHAKDLAAVRSTLNKFLAIRQLLPSQSMECRGCRFSIAGRSSGIDDASAGGCTGRRSLCIAS